MVLFPTDQRTGLLVRLIGLGLITWSIAGSGYLLHFSGRGLVVTVSFAAAFVCWLYWTARPGDVDSGAIGPELLITAAAGGVLAQAAPSGAGSAFTFVMVVAAGVRVDLSRAWIVPVVGGLAVAISDIVYSGSALGALAYCLGFAGALLGGNAARQSRLRAQQAELLLAQSQRSHEEALRAARLEESTRLARDIHDVLAHSLAGLTIQLEATSALIENGAERSAILARVQRAHELARDGLQETRRAVGALRGDAPSVPGALRALVSDHRSVDGAPVAFALDAEPEQLTGDAGQAVLRVVQEALTNITKHAPGATVSVSVTASDGELVAIVEDEPAAVTVPAGPEPLGRGLAGTGGGYGVRGMHERAAALGGTLSAGPSEHGWRVELRVPIAMAP